MLDHINRNRDAHILIIEDPVEFVHTPKKCQITHREVGEDTPSFADAIRSAGRENADVILVGDPRYGDPKRDKAIGLDAWLRRQCLHARDLELSASEAGFRVNAPLTQDFQRALVALGVTVDS